MAAVRLGNMPAATNKWIKYNNNNNSSRMSRGYHTHKQTTTATTSTTTTTTTTTTRRARPPTPATPATPTTTTTTTTQLCCRLSLLLPLIALSALPYASGNSINSSSSSGASNNNEQMQALLARKTPLAMDIDEAEVEANANSLNIIQRNYIIMHPASTADADREPSTDQSRSLKRAALTNQSITCNDGSHAGFYLRKQPSSKKWIVFLEGGWHCFDNRSCRARWLRLRHLMTSSQWPETRDAGGILSPHAEENPYWHNANHVLVPYCSSDSWSGTRIERDRDNNWFFMGALILRQVIADLIPLGLGRQPGGELLLVGSSAGGLGVMLNLDRVRDFLVNERKLQVTVRGVSDSGWFLDREPYTPSAVASSEAVRLGWKLWQGLLPEDCAKAHPTEPWRCYFGYRLYPTLKTPLFVFQWLFDEAQMRADNVGAPVTPQQWNYIHEMGGALRSSLDNVSAVFAPSCIGHAVLLKRDWVNIKIDEISVPAALRCWEHSTRPRRKRHDKLKRSTEATTTALQLEQPHSHSLHSHPHTHPHPHPHPHSHPNANNQRHQRHRQRAQKLNNLEEQAQRRRSHLTKEQREERKRRRQERQQRRKQRRRQQQQQQRKRENEAAAANSSGSGSGRGSGSGSKKHNNKQRRRPQLSPEQQLQRKLQRQQRRRQQQPGQRHNSSQPQPQPQPQSQPQQEQPSEPQKRRASNSASKPKTKPRQRQRLPRVPEKCGLRLLERCSWPQCNHSCPSLTNPLTGEEMRFLELLTSFGLDIEAVAAALGVDMHTLNNMERTELVNLLTQQVS